MRRSKWANLAEFNFADEHPLFSEKEKKSNFADRAYFLPFRYIIMFAYDFYRSNVS